ncbi:MAG: hypothetical protein AB7F86_16950 [Bdellovibrionales bacterium]
MVTRRRPIFRQTQGFSLLGTLVAISVGALIAVLLATVIREAVRGQRLVSDRDEMSDFSTYLRGLLSADSTCSSILNGKPFKPGGEVPLELEVGYRDQASANLKKGFEFADGSIVIDDLTIQDQSPSTVDFRVGVSNGKAIREVRVRRHLARIKLQLRNAGSSTAFRSRFFEVPVLINLESEKIESCNNEVSIADACLALGHKWDFTTNPPQCVLADSCLYGGAYTARRDGTCRPNDVNPATRDCSCPTGFTPVSAGSVNLLGNCSKGCDSILYDTVIQCFQCPSGGAG